MKTEHFLSALMIRMYELWVESSCPENQVEWLPCTQLVLVTQLRVVNLIVRSVPFPELKVVALDVLQIFSPSSQTSWSPLILIAKGCWSQRPSRSRSSCWKLGRSWLLLGRKTVRRSPAAGSILLTTGNPPVKDENQGF